MKVWSADEERKPMMRGHVEITGGRGAVFTVDEVVAEAPGRMPTCPGRVVSSLAAR